MALLIVEPSAMPLDEATNSPRLDTSAPGLVAGLAASSSILGRVFSTQHHAHVISLVRQVWSTAEGPAPPAERSDAGVDHSN